MIHRIGLVAGLEVKTLAIFLLIAATCSQHLSALNYFYFIKRTYPYSNQYLSIL